MSERYGFRERFGGRLSRVRAAGIVTALCIFGFIVGCEDDDDDGDDNQEQIEAGREIFRHDTFGDEHWWTDSLRLHEVIETAVSPTVALGVGLKVDADVLPKALLDTADVNSPATTIELLRHDAVLGLEAQISASNKIERVGVTCALCHSTVDNSIMEGIGSRLDGWANTELDPGKIVALSPYFNDKPLVRAALNSWGPGKYDAYFNHDEVSDPGRHSARLWPRRRRARELHRGGAGLLLECVCRRHADARPGVVLRLATRDRHHRVTRSSDVEAAGPARVPAQPCEAGAATGIVRPGRRRPRG